MSQGAKPSQAARKRAAVEMIARYEASLRRTARRYSFDAEDADDAYQRALEIALTKAPTTDPRELIRWTQTVTKHEALAVRQGRERMLGYPVRRDGVPQDPVSSLPARADGPDEQVERREEMARSREALKALKPAELRALSLLAEGYSYAEIGAMTGFSHTKVNRLLAEGRARLRSVLSSSEDGSRCRQLQPLLSAFCDGEVDAKEEAIVREHLRACGRCRATMRTYRAAPRIAAALLPAAPGGRSLLDRAHDFLAGLGARLPGLGGDSAASQVVAAGGSRGAGMAALAKLLTLCAAGAGGAAACVAGGVIPAPALAPRQVERPHLERPAASVLSAVADEGASYEPVAPAPVKQPKPKPDRNTPAPTPEPAEASTGAVEYEPPPPPTPVEASAPEVASSGPSGSAAGEFGP